MTLCLIPLCPVSQYDHEYVTGRYCRVTIQLHSTMCFIILQGHLASEPAAESGCRVKTDGFWVQVLDKEQGRHLGGSGMAFQ